MTTQSAVTELVQTAYRFHGGTGETSARVLREKRMKPLKIYISGKITGLNIEEAYELFCQAENRLYANGHDPVNPMTVIEQDDAGNDKPWIEYMLEDLKLLNDCDGIFLLSNWQDSNGARLERAFCEILGKPIFYQESPLPEVEG